MTYREYRTFDKSDWGVGPWNNEPDKVSWTDEATGLPCLIRRNDAGAFCGYVGVAPEHPWHGIGYSGCFADCGEAWCYEHSPEARVDVHGGLTFADGCQKGDEAKSICHIPEPGQTDDVWWFGFDCYHGFDRAPAAELRDRQRGWEPLVDNDAEYRDLSYVRKECERLAAQLSEVTA